MSGMAKGKATGFVKSLRTKSLLLFLHFMLDVVTSLSTLSLGLQLKNISIADVDSRKEATQNHLETLKTE